MPHPAPKPSENQPSARQTTARQTTAPQASAQGPTAGISGKRRLAALLTLALALTAAVAVGLFERSASAAPVPAGSPYGVAEHLIARPGGMSFSGWTIDPSSPKAAIKAYVAVDGTIAAYSVADQPRPDVAKLHPSAGPNHGFKFLVLIPEGKHRVCIRAQNVGTGRNVQFKCQIRTLDYGPIGAVQHVRAKNGQIAVSGWTVDWDQPKTPLSVAVTLDGMTTNVVADRTNAAALVPNHGLAGANHGFSIALPAAQGKHSLCVRVTNVGYGTDTTLTCRTVTLNDSPRGRFDYARQRAGQLHVVGWAFDPNALTAPATVVVKIDGTPHEVVAKLNRRDVTKSYPSAGTAHGFAPSFTVSEGSHKVCVTVRNVGLGSDLAFPCTTALINFTPTAAATGIVATSTGVRLGGWATDPDTSAAVKVRVSLDGRTVTTVTANRKRSSHRGHGFLATLNTTSGRHVLCAVAINASYGTHDSKPSCRTITLSLSPLGKFESLKWASGGVLATGWAFDPDTRSPITVAVTLDGHAAPSFKASALRNDLGRSYPQAGSSHGISSVISADDGEHQVCLTARNVGGGGDLSLGCRTVNAMHPVVPSAPQNVTAQAGYGGAIVSWTAPTSDGGAPWSKYVITASPGGLTTTVSASATSATVTGLKPSTTYTFTVQAVNVAGASAGTTSTAVTTQAGPPAQTTPAPVSTSRYIRNVRGASASELATMRSEGATDAYYNPSGHGYLMLLDIGGQDQFDGGVVLSATTRFVSYADLVKDIEAYVDGYASKQKFSAPAIIAIGTNNDMDVSSASGQAWADKVVDPVAAYTRARYSSITIAGANDIEPGFRAGYSQSRAWLSGYLGASSAPFVFNGSADGCAWTTINRGCNNGWSMAGLYTLAAGAAPTRILNLPQVYNYTMADQWKYISLTGVAKGQPRINFAGTLTEWTACDQTNSCGSISGHSAWSRMWSNLQSDSRLKVGTLPYSTDLRIDR